MRSSSPIITNQPHSCKDGIIFVPHLSPLLTHFINHAPSAHVMDPPSFVSKARTAFHSAAAKAERVFIDFKSDRDSEKQPASLQDEGESTGNHEVKHSQLKWRPARIGTKQDWQDRLRNIRIGRKGVEEPDKVEDSIMAAPFFDENLYMMNVKSDPEPKVSELSSLLERLNATDVNSIPAASILKQLAVVVENGKKFKSIKDCLASSGSSSPIMERASLSLSAVKSLVLRDKEDRLASDLGDDEKVLSLIRSLFDAEGNFLRRKIGLDSEAFTTTTLPREIHGAPPESFLVKLSEVIGSFKTLRKMALFWCKVVTELRRLWSEEQHIPGIPMDETPDLNSCLLYQQLQVFNCCLARKRRRTIATESLESAMRHCSSNIEDSSLSIDALPESPVLYARIITGELILRLGADHPTDLTMLETNEPVYAPITQEGPLLTEDLIRENEEFVLRTGSVGAGCSQLLSDMQAFKAANPGCILEDFVRWHSPPDWTENDQSNEAKECFDGGDSSSTRGQLSCRMQKEGNLWRELWETAKPVPAVKQVPLFDDELAAEGILNGLEDIPPSQLFEQFFLSLLGLGMVLADARLSTDDNLSKLFYECKDYVVATCQGSAWSEKVDDICQVYETVETMLTRPEEVLKKAEETTTTADELKSRFKRLTLNFGGKDRLKKPPLRDPKNSEENPTRQPFSSFFDGKSSLFSKKSPKRDNSALAEKSPKPSSSIPAEQSPQPNSSIAAEQSPQPNSSSPGEKSPQPNSATPAENPSCPDESDWTIV
ncbi:Rab3 GTPase-activating protein catalytic subunit [Melia azedarach]|uniref:Rab3 GTPase-activating protein catalytic subunit n=1 Tax=Melia azedarach TaxID=155640 RepID=A0ACC1YNV7_MELAZ|nr:Rab3 GTPase-activating protein catalytic subunit [Melia azedarach]